MFDFEIMDFVFVYEDDNNNTPPPDNQDGKPQFTEEQQQYINGIVAAEKRRYQSQVNDLTSKLQNLNLTQKQRDALEQELETVRSTLRTKEEQANHERTRLLETHKNEVKTLTEERDSWRNRYSSATIQRSLTDAAVAHDAFNPSQIVTLLAGDTQLVEEKDGDGNPTGNLVPITKLRVPGKDGAMQELTLSPKEAVKRMTEEPDLYGNLFKSGANGGLGGNTNRNGRSYTNLADLAKTNPEKYHELRKKGQLPKG